MVTAGLVPSFTAMIEDGIAAGTTMIETAS
jgi:hypothetical protein